LLQGRCRPLCRVFLGGTDNGIQQQHRADEACVGPFLDQQRHQGRCRQYVDQRAGELMQDDTDNARWLGRGRGVASIVLQPGGRFSLAQAVRRALQADQDLYGRPGVG